MFQKFGVPPAKLIGLSLKQLVCKMSYKRGLWRLSQMHAHKLPYIARNKVTVGETDTLTRWLITPVLYNNDIVEIRAIGSAMKDERSSCRCTPEVLRRKE